MGRSFLLGNSGYLGNDKRGEYRSSGTTGNVSVKKHYLERRRGNFEPITHCGASTTGVLYQEDWDDFVVGDWFVQDDTLNGWDVSSESASEGTNAGLVVLNTGGAYEYDDDQNAHLWVDLFIPAEVTNLTLDFDWKCDGESTFDYGYVWITDSGDTVTATPRESAADKNKRLGGDSSVTFTSNAFRRYNDNYNASSDTNWVSEPTIRLTADTTQSGPGDSGDVGIGTYVAGEYNRFYFSFTSDGSVENNPPFGVDNIIWSYTASTAICNDPNSPKPYVE